MKQFYPKTILTSVLLLVSAFIVYRAGAQYAAGEGGFRLGVDLVGGTILVYEVDEEKSEIARRQGQDGESVDMGKMVDFLKRRIDPNDLYNVTIRPVGENRVEIILPTGGAHQARVQEQKWQKLIEEIRANPPWKEALVNVDLDLERGKDRELISRVAAALDRKPWTELRAKIVGKYPAAKDVNFDAIPIGNVPALIESLREPTKASVDELKVFISTSFTSAEDEVQKFIAARTRDSGQKRFFSSEKVQEIKSLIATQGSLEFRIVANKKDDAPAIELAQEYLKSPENAEALAEAARRGLPPPPIRDGERRYSWVELGKLERKSLHLTNIDSSPLKSALEKAREKGEAYLYENPGYNDGEGRQGTTSMLLFSRPTANIRLTPEERVNKQFDYFMLLRDPDRDEDGRPMAITGEYLRRADVSDFDQAVTFEFDARGANLFYKVTSDNVPTPRGQKVDLTFRQLAILLDNEIVSAPTLNSAIGASGQIMMKGSPRQDIVNLATILRSGALPATLKREPVSESTIGPTLGSDTITKGTWAVGVAFVAVLIFMLIYYRFAGAVACVALLANLLMTVAFMIFVNAAFTLPGLAGLVLMLGMAVDANILIYERVREERDRGAALPLAIRNGYDRALPTILDTHLTSLFTAIILYAVGNDQLRGFGISLAVGLVISLYTALIVTRLIFDYWYAKGWLTDLSMLRLLSKPRINFMGLRNWFFAATLTLTLIGLSVFLVRGEVGLNIDFVGGTAYGGQLEKPLTIGQLRALLGAQSEKLAVTSVQQRSEDDPTAFQITYADGTSATVQLSSPPAGTTKAEREADLKARAATLPSWSVEQTFVIEPETPIGTSRFFTVRTTEKESDLVQVTVDRLLTTKTETGERETLLKSIQIPEFKVDGKKVTLTFSDFASPGYLKLLLDREFRAAGLGDVTSELRGEGKGLESRFKQMTLEMTGGYDPTRDGDKLQAVLAKTQQAFAARPQPERLERFDKLLAAETSARAFYAILASWAVILMYLWFRFGNWTFGLSAVLCLIHDLCFTLGAVAACHYLVNYLPGLASLLLIDDFKIDLTAVAAFLTLVGFSVNDTIVVFDRIREVRGKNPLLTPQIINDSINQTLSRTILSSVTVFLVVFTLYVFGGESIRLFAFIMCVGVLVGTYSSIYVASPLLLIFGEGAPIERDRKKALAAAVA